MFKGGGAGVENIVGKKKIRLFKKLGLYGKDVTITMTMISGERRINPVAIIPIYHKQRYWPSFGFKPATAFSAPTTGFSKKRTMMALDYHLSHFPHEMNSTFFVPIVPTCEPLVGVPEAPYE